MRVVLDVQASRADDSDPSPDDVERLVDYLSRAELVARYTYSGNVRVTLDEAEVQAVGGPHVELGSLELVDANDGCVVVPLIIDGSPVELRLTADQATGLETLLPLAVLMVQPGREDLADPVRLAGVAKIVAQAVR